MEPVTLASVTSAVVTLALDAAKEAAPQVVKDTWAKVKNWLGWAKTPPTEDLGTDVATALNANAETAARILAELKTSNAATASTLVSKITITTTTTVENYKAGRDVNVAKGENVNVGRMGG